MYHCDYKEKVVASFAKQIKYEYYGVNISIYIEAHQKDSTTTTVHSKQIIEYLK